MNAIRSGAVAAPRELRGVGRLLVEVRLDPVRADSRLIINQSYIMSKRSLFWGKASGKLGEAVYYRAGGEQRTRAYVKTVKNPKSYQQALQRTKFNNLVGVYKGLALAVKSFFTQRESNQTPFNAFFRKNWPLNLWVADKELTSKGEGIAQGFYVAVGSVGINTNIEPYEDLGGTNMYWPAWTINRGDMTIPKGSASAKQVKKGKQMYELLVGANNPYNLPSEFVVTAIKAVQGYAGNAFIVATLKCSATSESTWTLVQKSSSLNATDFDPDSVCEALGGTVTAATASDNGKVSGVTKLGFFDSKDTEPELELGVAVVVSFKDASGKQCTTSTIAYMEGLSQTSRDYLPTGDAGKSIISQYEVSNNLIE